MHPFSRRPTENETFVAKLFSFPVIGFFLLIFLVVAWNVQSGSRGCKKACEELGAADSTYIPARRKHYQHMPEECRCGFGEGGALAWRPIQP